MSKDIDEVFDSKEEISESKYRREMRNGGNTSKYASYRDLAADMEPGTVIRFTRGATANQIGGIRTQVYKLNDPDAEKDDREFEVRSRRKKTDDGRDVVEEGQALLNVYIHRRENGHNE